MFCISAVTTVTSVRLYINTLLQIQNSCTGGIRIAALQRSRGVQSVSWPTMLRTKEVQFRIGATISRPVLRTSHLSRTPFVSIIIPIIRLSIYFVYFTLFAYFISLHLPVNLLLVILCSTRFLEASQSQQITNFYSLLLTRVTFSS